MMFNKKETSKSKGNSIMPTAASHSLNSLVKGTTVEGTVRSESDIRVDGSIKGKLFCDAKVIIGPTGHIEGEIECQHAVIEGTFDGSIKVKELLTVRESATLSGDVLTDKLIVQSGAIFNVSCNMGGQQPAQKNGNNHVSSNNTANTTNNGADKGAKASKPA